MATRKKKPNKNRKAERRASETAIEAKKYVDQGNEISTVYRYSKDFITLPYMHDFCPWKNQIVNYLRSSWNLGSSFLPMFSTEAMKHDKSNFFFSSFEI